MDVFAKHHVD